MHYITDVCSYSEKIYSWDLSEIENVCYSAVENFSINFHNDSVACGVIFWKVLEKFCRCSYESALLCKIRSRFICIKFERSFFCGVWWLLSKTMQRHTC